MLVKDGIYHVVARANRKEFILHSPEMKEMFLSVLSRAKKRFDFKLINFCIMGNHIHFMIKPGGNENLSRIMQWILSTFAIRFNRTNALSGHVWYDRFKSKIVSEFRDFLHTFRYITENPVRAGLVHSPLAYRYNGVCFIRNRDYRIIEEPELYLHLMEPLICDSLLLADY